MTGGGTFQTKSSIEDRRRPGGQGGGRAVNPSFSCIIPSMNKRAKKRIKEALEKKNLERDKALEGKSHPSSNTLQQRRGFLPKPSKKRG
jgi:hypothetical protein